MEILLPPSDADGAQREIFETIRRHAGYGTLEREGLASTRDNDMIADTSSLHERARQLRMTHALVGQMPAEPPTIRGRLGAWIVSKIQRALFWYTPQILEFHRAATEAIETRVRVIEEMRGILSVLRHDLTEEIGARKGFETRAGSEIANLGGRVESKLATHAKETEARVVSAVAETRTTLEEQIREAEARAAERNRLEAARLGDSERKILTLRRGLVSQEMRLTVLLEQARKRLDEMGAGQLGGLAGEDAHKLDAFYLTFEDQFRGTREDILERFRTYVPTLKSHCIGGAEMPVLDLGCGRGEWLEVLRQEGLCASGVDANRLMLAECRKRKLEVAEGEAVEHLRSLEAESLGGVTGFHIIEHLPFPRLIDLLDETVRVLKPGGVAVFETPNPRNVLVATERFYFDPTHRNPLPSPLVQFLAEERGLCRVEVLELHPWPDAVRVPEDGSAVAERFNQFFYGPVDYAIIGWKA